MKKLKHLITISPVLILVLFNTILCTPAPPPGDGYEWVTVTTAGGTFTFSGNITLEVGAGAVSQTTRLYVRKLPESEINFFLLGRNITADKLLFAIEGTDGVTFNTDVTITVPSSNINPGAIPVIHVMDMKNKSYSQKGAKLLVDPAASTVKLYVSHFSGWSAEEYYKNKGDEYCSDPETGCRCGNIYVEQQDRDYTCYDLSTDCQILSTSSTVKYLDCPGEPQSDVEMEEISDGCGRALNLTSSKACINPDETANISAEVKVGCAGYPGQNVSFSVTGPATILPSSDVTMQDGKAGTVLTPTGDEGIAVVTATANISYYKTKMKVSFTGIGEENILEGLVQETITKTVNVYIAHLPIIELSADKTSISTSESTTISALVSKDGTPLPDQTVTFTVTGPATVSPASAVSSTTYPAETTLTAGNQEGTAVVTARCDVQMNIGGQDVTVPVEESISITIGPAWHVVMDVQINDWCFDDVNIFNLQINYTAHLEFDIGSNLPQTQSLLASGTLNQNLISHNFIVYPEWSASITNIDAPNTATFYIGGHQDPETHELIFYVGSFTSNDNIYKFISATVDYYSIEDPDMNYTWIICIANFTKGITGENTPIPFNIPFENGATYSGYTWASFWEGTCTITITKKQ